MPRGKELSHNICSIEELSKFTAISSSLKKELAAITQMHPMNVTPYYASLIDWKDPNDPLRSMAVPSRDELIETGSYDTSGESENTKVKGLQHKYKETALLLFSNQCAVYCRYCFRKRFVGVSDEEIAVDFSEAVDYIKGHPEINNVLISGGDPFMVPAKTLSDLLKALDGIKHLDFVRIGSRVPVTFPKRILEDDELLDVLRAGNKPQRPLYVVTQFNHPREITEQSMAAVSQLSSLGIRISNQTVLLRGVNDDPKTLVELMRKLTSIGVFPYYIFQCRPVKRVKDRFQTTLSDGYDIVEKAKKDLNGHAKRFRYVMSHVTGKIEIIGKDAAHFLFRYHEAKKESNQGRLFLAPFDKEAKWLGDL